MIVKVQLSLWLSTSVDASGNRDRRALIYNENEDFLIETDLATFPGLKEAMDGRQRAFFDADLEWFIDERCHGGSKDIGVHVPGCSCKKLLKLKKMLPDQGW